VTTSPTMASDRVNILLVDDQPAKLLTYEAILDGVDATLVTALSARDALNRLLDTEFAVVLVDVCMPDLDGFELASLIRDHPRCRRTAIIFVSGVHLTELDRLKRIAMALDPTGPDADLREALDVIIAYESAYAWALLAFERLLWLCREATTPVSDTSRASDRVLKRVTEALPGVVSTLEAALHRVRTPHLGANPEQLVDVRQFLVRMPAAVPNVRDVSDIVLSRHADVQHGKFDRGRRKLPWLERTSDGIALTMTRVGGLDREVTSPADIRPHFYRLAAADAFISARSAS